MAIKVYENKDLVRIRIKRQLYEQLEETAKRLGTTPDILVYNALLLTLKKLEGACMKQDRCCLLILIFTRSWLIDFLEVPQVL